MTDAWWADGVSFQCQPDCGRCCDQPGGIVYLAPTDAEKLAEHAGMDVEAWLRRDCTKTLDGRYILRSRQGDGICIYLNEKNNAMSIKFVLNNARHFHGGLKTFEVSVLGIK